LKTFGWSVTPVLSFTMSARVCRGVDSEHGVDEPKSRVVQIGEAVAIADRLELLLPHRERELADFGAIDTDVLCNTCCRHLVLR
jgi:hypothetical protein